MKSILSAAVLLAGFLYPVSAEPMPNPYPAPESGIRLTPEISEKPSINGARIYGMYQDAPFLFHVPVSGKRPMKIEAKGLPSGLKMDEKGTIQGRVSASGIHKVVVTASNADGQDQKIIVLRIGKALCLTPPMGWNSSRAYNVAVSQENILKIARLFVDKGLINHGWSYVNVGDGWQGERFDSAMWLKENKKFSNIGGMCQSIHDLGLKVGIYTTPWIGSYGGFIGSSAPSKREGEYAKFAIPEAQRQYPSQLFGPWPGSQKQKVDRVGDSWHFASDVHHWANCGFDYLKVEWSPVEVNLTKSMCKYMQKRTIGMVFSVSRAVDFKNVKELSKDANLWSISDYVTDDWVGISRILKDEKWFKFTRPGHWNDPGILQIGRMGETGQTSPLFRATNLTPDEQYAQMSLWCLLSAPLIMSNDLENIDGFTLGLITNDDVIAVNQDPTGKAAKRIEPKGELLLEIIAKPMEDGSLAVGFFNTGTKKATFKVKLKDLGLAGTLNVRDLWRRRDVGTVKDELNIEVNAHGVTLLQFEKGK